MVKRKKSAYEPSGPSGGCLCRFLKHEARRDISTPPGWSSIHLRATPSIKPGWREELWDLSAAEEHNTVSAARARTRTARSRFQRPNHYATAPPHIFGWAGVQFISKRCTLSWQRIRLLSMLQPFCFLPPFGINSVCPFVWLFPMPSRLVCITSTYAASPGSKRNRRSFFLKRDPAGSNAVNKKKLIKIDKYNEEALLYRTCKLLLAWCKQ